LFNKKEFEEYQLRQFLKALKLHHAIDNLTESETPDFIIHLFHSKLSIEITQFIDRQTKKSEALKKKIISLTGEKFQNERREMVVVSFDFEDKVLDYSSKFIENISDEVSISLLSEYSKRNTEIFKSSIELNPLLKEYFKKITITNELGFDDWRNPGAHKVPFVDEIKLKDCINKKHKSLIKYSHNFDENWLLIVAGLGRRSEDLPLTDLISYVITMRILYLTGFLFITICKKNIIKVK
jgi:predicted component of viral defense system (DUF524 family)